MKQLDKKQLPQIIALGVLTAGAGTYAAVHLAAPGPVSAGTRPAVPVTTPVPAVAVKPGDTKPGDTKPGDTKPGTTPALVAAADTSDAPPPTPGMRDPFAVGYVEAALPGTAAPPLPKLAPGRLVATVGGLSPLPVGLASAFSLPPAPALPGGGAGRPLPSLPSGPPAPPLPSPAAAVPAAPAWTVTGVLLGAGGKVAILRSGEARRIVRSGDFVDSTYRVAAVSRTAVVLRHGLWVYQLKLGGAPKTGLSAAPAAAPVPPKAAPVAMGCANLGRTSISIPQGLTPQGRARQELMLTANALSVPRSPLPHTNPKAAAARVARTISLGLRLLDGTVLTAHPD